MSTPPQMFDRALIARRRARRTGSEPDFVTKLVTEDMDERLLTVSRRFGQALVMGPDGRHLPSASRTGGGPVVFSKAATLVAAKDAPLVDPEALGLPRSDYDLIVSLLDLQIVNDVPGFLARIRMHLVPDGLFLAAVLGGASLAELRSAWITADTERSGGVFARVAPFMDIRDAGALLQRAGLSLPVTDVETHKVRYGSPLALMTDLRSLGASNPLADRPKRITTPRLLAAAGSAYEQQAQDPDGRIFASLEIIWMSGWSPHETQQKPLRPGSAKVSLSSVLPSRR